MKILNIETSCDESAISIVEFKDEYWAGESFKQIDILGDSLNSQAELHAEFGGVYPNLAKREHSKNLVPILTHALLQADMLLRAPKPSVEKEKLDKIKEILQREPELYAKLLIFFAQYEKPPIDAISVVVGPGLAPALWVGVNFARALAFAWNLSAVKANHMEGHFYSAQFKNPLNFEKEEYLLETIDYPAIALLLSGGHTEIVLANESLKYKKFGETLDDAVGEAYDKVARLLELGYPGGPEISKLSDEFEKSNKEKDERIKLPRPKMRDEDLNFSFSGLKTAVLRLVQDLQKEGNLNDDIKSQIAYEFELAVQDVVLSKLSKAFEQNPSVKTLIFAGGVSANRRLRDALGDFAKEHSLKYLLPTKELTGDNALMSALASANRLQILREKAFSDPDNLQADSSWEIDEL